MVICYSSHRKLAPMSRFYQALNHGTHTSHLLFFPEISLLECSVPFHSEWDNLGLLYNSLPKTSFTAFMAETHWCEDPCFDLGFLSCFARVHPQVTCWERNAFWVFQCPRSSLPLFTFNCLGENIILDLKSFSLRTLASLIHILLQISLLNPLWNFLEYSLYPWFPEISPWHVQVCLFKIHSAWL